MIEHSSWLSPQPPFYQGMTPLPRSIEEGLLTVPYPSLVAKLKSRTKVVGADSIYTLVQLLAKNFSESELNSFLASDPKDRPTYHPPQSPIPRPTPAPAPSGVFAALSSKPRAASKGSGHPQPVIDAKTDAAKLKGGSIVYDRGGRNWRCTKADGTVFAMSSQEFRDKSVEEVAAMF